MESKGRKRTVSLRVVILLVILIAAGGASIALFQYEQRQKYIRATETAWAENEAHVNSIFTRIESNLAKIRERESMIHKNFATPDDYSGLAPTERIQNEIDFIDHLLSENNYLIAKLNEQLENKDTRLKGVEAANRDLKARISKYQEEVNLLLAEKEALQRSYDESVQYSRTLANKVDTLGREVSMKSQEIENQKILLDQKEKSLNKAYYAIGSYKSLRDMDILQKEGGFLGINRVMTLTDDPDVHLFQEIDTREVKKIPVMAERWEMVTGHDPNSFELQYDNKKTEWIHITDPEKFWKKSKYLVIVIRESDFNELAASR